MKKLSVLITALFLQSLFAFSAYAETYVPSRMIHIVYDDSGSMIKDDDEVYVDTWCQAKYALEVVAAMLGERDTLKVYYMSEYDKGRTGEPLALQGSRDAAKVSENVAQIHNRVTAFSNTPFAAVQKAGIDFKTSSADENWLVILTDGEFDSISKQEVENYYYQVAASPNTKVIMLAMGAHVSPIEAAPERGVYFEHARTSDEIRSRLTSICNRIFQRNALPKVAADDVSFGVPMSQLIVFAQGSDVQIGSAKGANGTQFAPSSNVHAAWSELAATNLPHPESVVVNKTLNGQVATFEGDFRPDSYQFDIVGADSIEIYYKPNVEVTKDEKLINGTYRVEFGFVGASDKEKVRDTSLLGKIDYSAEIVNTTADGTPHSMQVKSGDTISIKEGTLTVDVTAKFLEYNSVNTKSSYQVFFANKLIWSFEQKPEYSLVKDGFSNGSQPLVLSVKMKDGEEIRALTREEWAVMAVPRMKFTDRDEDKKNKTSLGEFKIEKQEEIGQFFAYPALSSDGPMKTSTGDLPVVISGSFSRGDSTAAGTFKDSIVVTDDITAWERFLNWLEENWSWLWKTIAGFILFCGYAFKKRLPKDIKKAPVIEASPKRVGVKKTSYKASYKKNPAQILIPFRADTAALIFPSALDTEGVPKRFQLRAMGGKKLQVVNKNAFAEKKNITLGSTDGTMISKNSKRPVILTSSATIVIKTKDYNYSCTLNK